MASTIVLLHGFTHTGASWEPVTAALGTSYRSLAPEIRGHGRASGRQPVTLEAVIGDLDELAPASFTLVGYSMGGRIALHAALALGERVRRLVLIGASPGIADSAQRAARRAGDEQLADEIEREGVTIERFARKWAQTPVLAGQPPPVAAAVHADRLRSTPAGLARALRGLGTGALEPLWNRLEDLQMPVTLVAGERDVKFRAIAEEMAPAIMAGEVVIVPVAGHAVHLEAPERTAAILAAGE
ncbi:MAG: alpha/beta fold hydrolase [Solirubrobacteraceae bacterium]